eukprot:scaffold12233_cov78-Skeletonema_dohrnii-CCMP3373.AAC.3
MVWEKIEQSQAAKAAIPTHAAGRDMNILLVNVSFGAQVELCRYKMRYKPNSKGRVCIRHGAKKNEALRGCANIVQNKTFGRDMGQMKRCSIEGYLTTLDLTNTND